jgi:hypothetical protein
MACDVHGFPVLRVNKLIKVLAGAPREREREVKGGGGRGRLLDINTERLLELKYKLICHFKLVADMVEEFVNDTDRPAFLKGN